MTTEEEREYLARYNIHDYPVPLTTVDVVVLSLCRDALWVQLVEREEHPFRGWWSLPGGFVDVNQDEDLDASALRVLRQKTGVDAPYLEQLGGFGDKHRDPRGWAATFVYFALVQREALTPEPVQGRWWPLQTDQVQPPLAFDHSRLLRSAIERLRNKVTYSSLPLHLLPDRFTLPQCQRVFEIVLGLKLEKSAFRRRLLDAETVEEIPGAFERSSNRPAQLYRLRSENKTVFFPGVLKGVKAAERESP